MASHPTQPNEQRRRLLKAASAAPVIFTLPVGSSVAAGSVQCDLKDGNAVSTYTETNEDLTTTKKVDIGEQTFTITSDTTTIQTSDGQVYFVDDLDGLPPRLVTESCWNSVFASAASSSTNIV